MIQANIHCCKCGKNFIVYWNNVSQDSEIICPECRSQMENSMANKVIHLMGAVNDLNYHFSKHNAEYNEPAFVISIEDDRR